MDITNEELTASGDDTPIEESLSPLIARQIESESRERAATQPGDTLEHYRRGRVEAETRRISEEMTQQAQERLRLAATQAQSQQHEEEFHSAEREEAAQPIDVPFSSFTGEDTLPAPKLLRHLLVPLDGTPEGERTLPYASMLARLLHARLMLSHVTPTADANGIARALHMAGSTRQAAQQAFEPQALLYLQGLRGHLSTPPEQVDTLHMSAPSVVDGLLELASINDTDLVILGLRSHHGTDHLRLGRVVDSLVCRSSTPVLVIPPHVTAGSYLFTLRHILVPLDGSALAEEALAPLLGLLGQTKGEAGAPMAVTLLGVAEDSAKLPESQSYLDALRAVLIEMPECARVQLRAVTALGSAPEAIVAMVEHGTEEGGVIYASTSPTGPVDLLIMATHGRGGIGRLVLGSVAEYVLPRAPVPVLLVHPTYLTV